jgi:hypothetical protein
LNLTKENLTIHSKNYKMLCPFVIDFIGKNTQNEGKNNKKKLIQKKLSLPIFNQKIII